MNRHCCKSGPKNTSGNHRVARRTASIGACISMTWGAKGNGRSRETARPGNASARTAASCPERNGRFQGDPGLRAPVTPQAETDCTEPTRAARFHGSGRGWDRLRLPPDQPGQETLPIVNARQLHRPRSLQQ